MAEAPTIIISQPGIKRDGTQFEGENYVDGQWCRFQRGRPRKIAGYQSVTSTMPELVRGMRNDANNGNQYLHAGGASTLTQIVMNAQGQITGQNARIPAGFANSINNLWQFDRMRDLVGAARKLIAHGAPNLAAIDSTVEVPIYYGDLSGAAVLTNSGMNQQSGGVLVLAPYLLTFGNNGRVDASPINDPTLTAGSAFVTNSKLVYGQPIRGNGTGPGGLLWSLDALVRVTFLDAALTVPFAFDELTVQSSLLSSQGIIDYDGIQYWPGVDRFLMFNGVVREIPNQMNLNWFFDNLNFAQRQKVFAYKVPRFGEIWWCYPRGSAVECTHAVIYNVRENTWYDTTLPDGGRCAGYFTSVYERPFMVDLVPVATLFTLWQHETGVDKIDGSSVQPVRSYFETAEIAMMTSATPQNKSIRVGRIEPDFVQTGDLTVQTTGRANARAPEQAGETFTFPDVASTPEQETVPMKEVRRLMRFRFESNTAGGDYQMGQCLAHVEPADGRITS